MDKETLNILISKIKEIDKALDAYEYMNLTFDEYKDAIKEHRHGNMSLRNRVIRGSHLWSDWMEMTIQRTKDIANLLWADSIDTMSKKDIELVIKGLGRTRDAFVNKTDNLSIYPIQSELIRDNINDIINILRKIY